MDLTLEDLLSLSAKELFVFHLKDLSGVRETIVLTERRIVLLGKMIENFARIKKLIKKEKSLCKEIVFRSKLTISEAEELSKEFEEQIRIFKGAIEMENISIRTEEEIINFLKADANCVQAVQDSLIRKFEHKHRVREDMILLKTFEENLEEQKKKKETSEKRIAKCRKYLKEEPRKRKENNLMLKSKRTNLRIC